MKIPYKGSRAPNIVPIRTRTITWPCYPFGSTVAHISLRIPQTGVSGILPVLASEPEYRILRTLQEWDLGLALGAARLPNDAAVGASTQLPR